MARNQTSRRTSKEIWGWWFFDWASQPYHTLLVTFVFGPYFAFAATQHFLDIGLENAAAKAQAQATWSTCLSIIGLVIGLCAPFWGAWADATGRRMRWMKVFALFCMIGAAGLWYAAPDGSNLWFAMVSFGIGFIAVEFAAIFVNAQLPTLANRDDIGEVSGSGFAFGYLGGVIALFIALLLFVEQGNGKTLIGIDPILGLNATTKEGTRAIGPFVAIWFAVFLTPYFIWVKDTPRDRVQSVSLVQAFSSVIKTVKALRGRKSLSMFLGASMLYRDALNGIYGFGGVYAGLVLGWDIPQIGKFGVVAAISSVVLCWLGGRADRRFGPKPVIMVSIFALCLVCITIICMSRQQLFGVPLPSGSILPDVIFFGCGIVIGGFGGTLQAASRTLMVRHTIAQTATQAFGLYGLTGRATAFLAPGLITGVTLLTENARIGLTPVLGLFLLGLFLLFWVDAAGDQA